MTIPRHLIHFEIRLLFLLCILCRKIVSFRLKGINALSALIGRELPRILIFLDTSFLLRPLTEVPSYKLYWAYLGLTGDEDTVGYESERMKTVDYKNIGGVKGRREFVIQKKERRMRQGKEVKHGNSKYTGRKRRPKFWNSNIPIKKIRNMWFCVFSLQWTDLFCREMCFIPFILPVSSV